MSNETLIIVIVSVVGTLMAVWIGYGIVTAVDSGVKLLKTLIVALREAAMRAYELRAVLISLQSTLNGLQSELAYLRNATSPILESREEPHPPIGRVGTMPPPFPTPVWAQPQAPDATPDDTDMEILNETDRDIIEAQVREEMKAKGIEPDDDDERQAVVEEV